MKRILSNTLGALLLIGGLIAAGILTGLVGIHYPRVTENEPLNNPIIVLKADNDHLHLEDGRVIQIDYWNLRGTPSTLMNITKHRVEVHQDSSGAITVYGNEKGWICGTPWAKLITIPIIPDNVYRNRKQFLAEGSIHDGDPP
jgi:hypothetical protein